LDLLIVRTVFCHQVVAIMNALGQVRTVWYVFDVMMVLCNGLKEWNGC
jgi:hypothetical protein